MTLYLWTPNPRAESPRRGDKVESKLEPLVGLREKEINISKDKAICNFFE